MTASGLILQNSIYSTLSDFSVLASGKDKSFFFFLWSNESSTNVFEPVTAAQPDQYGTLTTY